MSEPAPGTPEVEETAAEPASSSQWDGLITRDRIELLSTIVLAAAVILTAWSAFQAGKWGGVQAVKFSEAGATRTESTRFDTRAGQLVQIDVALYMDWVTAFTEDVETGSIPDPGTAAAYVPTPGTLSGFVYLRMRDEFKPAIEAWLQTDPINNPDAPATPFEMDEYVLAAQEEAVLLQETADLRGVEAREANQNGDNYVLTAVLFAAVLFFTGISSKLDTKWGRRITLGMGFLLLIVGATIVFSLPVEI